MGAQKKKTLFSAPLWGSRVTSPAVGLEHSQWPKEVGPVGTSSQGWLQGP